jgi:NADH:ubiquinone oxidoreductase subunit 6 (subunit J)
MRLLVKTPWFKPAKTYRGLQISTWQGAIIVLIFFAIMIIDVTYTFSPPVKIMVGLVAIVTLGFIVYRTADLKNNNVF